jgi:hypothetical protein
VIVDDRFVEDLGDRTARLSVLDEFGGAVHVVGAEHDIHVRSTGADCVLILLGETPGHDDLATVALPLPSLEMPEVAVQLVVGVLPDAARVEHDDVGIVLGLSRRQTVGLEQPGDAFRIVFVHLAPEGANDEAAAHMRSEATGELTTAGAP